MKKTRTVCALCLVLGLSVSLPPASAHPRDVMQPNHAGPILRGETPDGSTSMEEMREWFGEPTSTKVVRVACVRVLRAKWGDDIKVYARRDGSVIDGIFIRSRTITSTKHGDLTMHTGKGLRIEDSERKLRRLYPDAKPITHAGHTHYRLKTGGFGSYLMAKVVDDVVIRFESWPYEFC